MSTDPGEVVAAFEQAMREAGIELAEPIKADGKFHRANLRGRHSGKTGYYVLHVDGIRPSGHFGAWNGVAGQNWSYGGAPLTAAERREIAERAEADRRQREAETQLRQANARARAQAEVDGGSPAEPDHPYLARKSVGTHGLRVDREDRLLVPMRDIEGVLWSLQRISGDGEKRFLTGGRVQGTFHLFGELGDRIIICEGFATAATIREATGETAVVAFNTGNLQPVAEAIRTLRPHAQIVIAADDDWLTTKPIENPGIHFARQAAEAIGAGLAVPAFAGERPEKATDFNDLAATAGLGSVRAIIAAAWPNASQARPAPVWRGPVVEPHFMADELDPAEASIRLKTLIRGFIEKARGYAPVPGEPAPVLGVRASAGLGKTTAVLDDLARVNVKPQMRGLYFGPRMVVDFYLPRHKLADELVAKAHERGLEAKAIRGRSYRPDGPDGEALCRKHLEAAALATAGLSVWGNLCERKREDGTAERCEFHDTCPFVAQFRPTGGIRVFAHEHLALPQDERLGKPNLVVVDETFHQKLVRHVEIPLDRLMAPRAWGGSMAKVRESKRLDLEGIAHSVARALQGDRHPRDAGVTIDDCEFAADIEWRAAEASPIWPGQTWAEQRRVIAGMKQREALKLHRFWEVLAEEIERPGPMQRIRLLQDVPGKDGELRDMIRVDYRAELKLPAVPKLVIDADLDPVIVREFWPGIQIETIAARRNALVTQVYDTECSRQRLLAWDGAPEAEVKRAANRLADVQALLNVEALRGPTLLVTYKAVAAKLVAPEGSAVAHFGAIRGLDCFKGFQAVIIVGREQPSARPAETRPLDSGMEDHARAIFGNSGEPLNLGGGYVTVERGYRMRDGSKRGAKVPVHPDARVQAIVEQPREREMVQAIDRVRPVHRPEPARVLIMSSIPLDLTVDRLVRWNELIPSRLEQAAARGDAVPLSPAELARVFPDLWASARAAETDMQRREKVRRSLIDVSIWALRTFSRPARYWRLPGQTKPFQAAIREGVDPETALVAAVGPVLRWALDLPAPAITKEERPMTWTAAGPSPRRAGASSLLTRQVTSAGRKMFSIGRFWPGRGLYLGPLSSPWETSHAWQARARPAAELIGALPPAS